MQLFSLRNCTVLLLILLLAACKGEEKPVSKEEAAQMASDLQASIKKRNATKFNEAFDVEALMERMKKVASFKMNVATVRGVAEGFKSGQLGTELIRSLGKGGTYELVKQYEKDKKQHLVFRLFGSDGKMNYHDLELVKKKEQIKVADMFIYLSGENLSTTLAQTMAMMDENYDSMSKSERSKISDVKKIRRLLTEGKYDEANKLYQQLPDLLKQQKMAMIINVEIASGLGDEAYTKSMDDYEKAFPDAPNMYLMKIDASILRKDYAGALKAVNQLDSLINKDDLLDYHRGLISNLTKDKEAQRMYFERLVANKPDFAPGTLELMVHYLENDDTDKAVPLFKKYQANPDADKDQIDALFTLYPDLKKKVG
ncbi:MAG: hypothetical protein J7578_09180 [Chitinophagaceae bacterium]|nr:hypothetical protein [Chitinophagaceae bacterium]